MTFPCDGFSFAKIQKTVSLRKNEKNSELYIFAVTKSALLRLTEKVT